MTQEKEIKRPIQELEHAPIPKIEPWSVKIQKPTVRVIRR